MFRIRRRFEVFWHRATSPAPRWRSGIAPGSVLPVSPSGSAGNTGILPRSRKNFFDPLSSRCFAFFSCHFLPPSPFFFWCAGSGAALKTVYRPAFPHFFVKQKRQYACFLAWQYCLWLHIRLLSVYAGFPGGVCGIPTYPGMTPLATNPPGESALACAFTVARPSRPIY